MDLTRKDLLCEGAHTGTGERVIGWYCEGNVLEGGADARERISYIIPVYPDLRKSTTGVTSLHGFVEVVPESVSLAEIKNNE